MARFDSASYTADGPRGSTNAIPIPSEPMRGASAGGASFESSDSRGYDRDEAYQPRPYDSQARGYSGSPAGYGSQRAYGGAQQSYQAPAPYQGQQQRGYSGQSGQPSYNDLKYSFGAPRQGSEPQQPSYGGGPQQGYQPVQPSYGSQPRGYESGQSSYDTGARTYGSQAEGRERVASLHQPQPSLAIAEPRLASRPASSSAQPAANSAAPASRPAPVTRLAGGDTIEVRPGDTLSSLAREYRMSVSELMKLNNLENPNLHPGQKIVIPKSKRALARRAPAPDAGAQLAAQTNASAHTASSGHVPPVGGQALGAQPRQIPVVASRDAASSSPDWQGTYTISPGESLYGIARKHGVKVADLQRVNAITDPRTVRAGTVLKVPGGAAQPAVVAAAERERPVAEQISAPSSPSQGTVVTVRPRIINSETSQPTEPKRVASLGPSAQTATDASPGGGTSNEQANGLPEAPKLAGTGKFRWPVKGRIIAGFGVKSDRTRNDGINISVPQGTEVLAAENGVVAYAGNELKGYGNLILIRHDGGWVSAYAHNDDMLVKRGDKVRRGQPIAKAGSTGAVDQPQVHFELRRDSKPIDPIPYMEQ